MVDEFILVTNWEVVDKDDFYLTKEWLKNNQDKTNEEIKELLREVNNKSVYYGYIVKAVDYAIYYQMDSQQVLINSNCEVLVECESSIIDNKHEYKELYEY